MSSQQPDLLVGDALQQTHDFLPTPAWFSSPVLAQVLDNYLIDDEQLHLLDAGCGTGLLGLQAELVCPEELRPMKVTGVDVDHERLALCPEHWDRAEADFFAWSAEQQSVGRVFDLVVTNPPFSDWWKWVEACLPLVGRGGTLLAVAQVSWLGQRVPWWEERKPTAIHFTGRRPWPKSVRECCWVEWARGNPDPTVVSWFGGGGR
jgi:SAM-dependent methyltransferase